MTTGHLHTVLVSAVTMTMVSSLDDNMVQVPWQQFLHFELLLSHLSHDLLL